MDIWLNAFKDASESQIMQNAEAVAELFSLDLSSPHIAAIQDDLAAKPDTDINHRVENAHILNHEWPGFESLCKAYLHWCQNVQSSTPQLSFESYARVFISLQQAYANQRGACLNILVRNVTSWMLRLFMNHGKLYIEWMAGIVLKMSSTMRNERDPSSFRTSKKFNALFYTNMVMRMYFKSQQFVLAENVFKNMDKLGIEFSNFSLSEQVEYRYWLGRFCLFENKLVKAYKHLDWAFSQCLPSQSQYYLILDWLVIPSTLLGRFPAYELLSKLSIEAQTAVGCVFDAMRTGRFTSNYESVLETNLWIQSRHLRPLIETNLPELVTRQALLRLSKLSSLNQLPLELCRAALSYTEAEDPDLLFTEGRCIRLVNVGMLKAKLLPRNQALLLKPVGAFPSLREFYAAKIKASPEWLL